MSLSIRANGLEISHKGSGGHEKNTTPDVCLTPPQPLPIPYSIISYTKDLIRGSTSVLADGSNSIAIKGSAHHTGYGDAPGSKKGVGSGTNLHESTWITYSPNIYIEGKNVCRKTDKLFMNNKNCVSAAGNYEPPVSIKDPVMRELCKIFCEARDKWHKCKKSSKPKCSRPSKLAEDKTVAKLKNGNSRLNKAVKSKFPGRVGRAEKTFFAAIDDVAAKMFQGARKVYDKAGMERAIKRQINKYMARQGIKQGAKMAGRAWLKAIPGLNVVSTIYDVVDLAVTGYEVYDMVKQANLIDDHAVKVKPDFAIEGPDGEVEDIYDFKFDDPDTNYQDKWQDKQKQREAYRKASGKEPKKVDNAKCKCDKNKVSV